ncbi:hypothetical protein RHOSPDRAFT_36209 [Rhodotorula sp. JG-1b]|nr:hypothetical protein RHOSPDRAFT_36209 [Rhodotorula sp. JG-1b]
MKRKASDPVDLTADSDADCSSADDSNRASTSTSTSKTSKNNKKKKVAAPRHLEVAQSLAKSEGLGPRSVLLGGAGTGQEHAGRLKVSQKIVAADDDDQAAAPPPKPKRRTVHRETPNQILPFKVESKNNEGPAELIARLAYGEPHLYLLGRVKDGRGRRKKHEYSDSDEDDDDADKPFTIETLVGPDPDKHVQSVMWIAPKVQTPWLPKQFKTAHLSKARDENAGHESLSDGDVDATDDKKKKGKKVKKPQKVQAPTKKSLLVVCGADGSSSAEAATVIHHAKPQEGFGASFSIILRHSFAEKDHLRLAIGRPEATPEAWSSVEHAIWLQDLPRLSQPATSLDANPTHTEFSRSLLEFLRSDSLALCTSDENSKAASDALVQLERNLCRFDFSSTENLRLVVSHAGSHDGEDKVAEAGGLTSLANAIASLSPSCDGQGDWKIEYLTPEVGSLSRDFLEQLHAAAQGISPLEYAEAQTNRAKAAEAAFAAAHGKPKAERVKVLYPTEATVKDSKEQAGRHLIKWEGDKGLDDLQTGDLRKTVLRQLELKSGRLNGSALMIILHKPTLPAASEEEPEPFEAFLYNGSHLPSPDSWDTYRRSSGPANSTCDLARTDLGVLYRCATASTAKKLEKLVSALVPYVRTPELEEFGDGDEPAPTFAPKPKKAPGRPKGSGSGSKGKGKAAGGK